jgi:hypothetical protein
VYFYPQLVPNGNAVADSFVAAVLGNEIDPDGFIPKCRKDKNFVAFGGLL